MKHWAFWTIILVISSGCASYKNPGPNGPPHFTTDELSRRLHLSVLILKPRISDFSAITDESEQEWRREAADRESQRLQRILLDCQIFDGVTLGDSPVDGGAVVLRALPRNIERTGLDDPWLLLYGGVIPSYSKNERGVAFRVLRPNSGDFVFKWTEEVVIGLWAPAVAGSSGKWESSRARSTYWVDLRHELLRTFAMLENSKPANKSLQPTSPSATPHAGARVAPRDRG